jgi:hypothetical protein
MRFLVLTAFLLLVLHVNGVEPVYDLQLEQLQPAEVGYSRRRTFSPTACYVVFADPDKKENFIFFTEVEEKLGGSGDKTPVLLWQGKLYYSNEGIKRIK